MPSRSLLLGVSVAGLLAGAGCGAAPDGQDPGALGVTSEGIQGGYEDSHDTGVVGVYDLELHTICTGSLIAPNVVLTARHCVATVVDDDPKYGVVCGKTGFGAAYGAARFSITAKENFFDASPDHLVREVITPPDTDFCGDDLAILILQTSVPSGEASPLVPRIDGAIGAKSAYSALGYGATIDDQAGTGAGLRRRRDDLIIDCVGAACPKGPTVPSVAIAEWAGHEGICHGDSGGPALDAANRVIGVASRGGPNCMTPVYGYIFSWAKWIKDTTVYAAGLAGRPPPPWATGYPTDPEYSYPLGDKCDKPDTCASDRCINDGTAQYCTRSCTAEAPCPDGYTCADQSLQVCVQKHGLVSEEPTPTPPGQTPSGCSTSPGGAPAREEPACIGGALLALAALRRRVRRG